ncbi:MAG TPA: hypothetical protein VHG32_08880 [Thermoanaerobaculia bacterium]|jgi:hypothetical protein|nr:hypothetical protein [Thermoanaerobaculia bacterium]
MADNVRDLRAWRRRSGEPPHLTDWQRFVCLSGGLVFVCVGLPLAALLGWAVATIGRPGGIIAGIIVFGNLLPLPRASDGSATDGRQILDVLRAGV